MVYSFTGFTLGDGEYMNFPIMEVYKPEHDYGDGNPMMWMEGIKSHSHYILISDKKNCAILLMLLVHSYPHFSV